MNHHHCLLLLLLLLRKSFYCQESGVSKSLTRSTELPEKNRSDLALDFIQYIYLPVRCQAKNAFYLMDTSQDEASEFEFGNLVEFEEEEEEEEEVRKQVMQPRPSG